MSISHSQPLVERSWKELSRLRGVSLLFFLQLMAYIHCPGKLRRNTTSLLIDPTEETSQPVVKDRYRHNMWLCLFPWTHSVCNHVYEYVLTKRRLPLWSSFQQPHRDQRDNACAWAKPKSLLTVQQHTANGRITSVKHFHRGGWVLLFSPQHNAGL